MTSFPCQGLCKIKWVLRLLDHSRKNIYSQKKEGLPSIRIKNETDLAKLKKDNRWLYVSYYSYLYYVHASIRLICVYVSHSVFIRMSVCFINLHNYLHLPQFSLYLYTKQSPFTLITTQLFKYITYKHRNNHSYIVSTATTRLTITNNVHKHNMFIHTYIYHYRQILSILFLIYPRQHLLLLYSQQLLSIKYLWFQSISRIFNTILVK